MTDEMLQVFDAIAALTLAFDHYLQGEPDSLTLGQLYKTRTAIGKRLMLLPNNKELNMIPDSSSNIYECCRLTALIFGVAVVFQEPVLKSYDILQVYVTDLKSVIEDSDLYKSNAQNNSLSGVFLWILVLGGIAALDRPERRWFVSQLALLVERMKLEWCGVQKILETFLWLDSACGAGARDLWAKVENLAF
jgi:hypothetical protein